MKKNILFFLLTILLIFIFGSAKEAFGLDCAKGHETHNSRCYIPKTNLSYDKYNSFFSEYYYCGFDCDYDGRNCKGGVCNIADCAKGYTEIKKGKCYNPELLIYYEPINHNNTYFYYGDNADYCGFNCTFDGRNCRKGICNIEDCPDGYKYIRGGSCYDRFGKTKEKTIKQQFYIEFIKNIPVLLLFPLLCGDSVIALLDTIFIILLGWFFLWIIFKIFPPK